MLEGPHIALSRTLLRRLCRGRSFANPSRHSNIHERYLQPQLRCGEPVCVIHICTHETWLGSLLCLMQHGRACVVWLGYCSIMEALLTWVTREAQDNSPRQTHTGPTSCVVTSCRTKLSRCVGFVDLAASTGVCVCVCVCVCRARMVQVQVS